eukprot:CAMPEP_0115108160 /NCGR_PEP_ID=MMETSP0227-20121206/37809_1 /TAXON_ID=89957 /ORGANISM="Polarella glacialis, Strain CCMP 1383" /LENGTH=47 /DNA_ID= /DNA_START= /DNA_END= /DNA_ORIENTATION=
MDVAAEENPFGIGGPRDEEDPDDEEEVLETPTEDPFFTWVCSNLASQ